MKYRSRYDSELSVPYKAIPETPDIPQVVPETYKKEAVKKEKAETPKKSHVKTETNSVQATSSQIDEDKPVFKIQFMASSRKLLPGDAHFKSLLGYDFYEEENIIKYTYGSSNNYNEIYKLRKKILNEFPDAFIIAFKNGAKMNVNEAIREFKTNKK
jgi:N-acetylmuramoyl-L-alanine amidase